MSRVSGVCMSALAMSMCLGGIAHAQVADRYGPSAPAYDGPNAQTEPSPALAGAPVRMLSWPGKVAPPPGLMTPDAPASELRPGVTPVRAVAGPTPGAMQIASAAVAPSPHAYPAARYAPAGADAPMAKTLTKTLAKPSATSPHYGLVQAVPRQPVEDAAAIYAAPAARPSAPSTSARAASVLARAPVASRRTQAGETPAAATHAASVQAASTQPQSGQPQSGQPQSGQLASGQFASGQPAAAIPADTAHPGWAPPRHPWSQAGDNNVRFYSLHRQYGVAPDPAPLPPQFFAATADLGEPSGPMTRTLSGAGSSAQAARAVQAAQAETSADAASSQP